jgi:hypothetical protein
MKTIKIKRLINGRANNNTKNPGSEDPFWSTRYVLHWSLEYKEIDLRENRRRPSRLDNSETLAITKYTTMYAW